MSINWRKNAAEVGRLSREVVARRAGIASGLGLVLAVVNSNHLLPQPWTGDIQHGVNVGIDLLAAIITAAGIIRARAAATPADPSLYPKDIHGDDLVSALRVGPHAGIEDASPDAAAAFAAAATIQAAGSTSTQHDPTVPTVDPAPTGGQAGTSTAPAVEG